jgi:protoheme IX farnesyltransferase
MGLFIQWILGILITLNLFYGRIYSENVSVLLRTTHVTMGALLLGLSLLIFLWSWGSRVTATRATSSVRWNTLGTKSLGSFRDYLALAKPGISVMTVLTTLAGFLLGSRGEVNGGLLIHIGVGIFLVSSGACALNMFLERDVDGRMHRTEERPLPAGRLTPQSALIFGLLLSGIGLAYVGWTLNFWTASLSGLALGIYLSLYTPLKKVSVLSTAVGAVSGALPPAIGWVAATGRWEMGTSIVFGILFFWQFPHFFSLAWLYRDDYARAGFPLLPVVEPDGESTARKIVLNTFALLSVSLLPTFLGLAGPAYSGAALLLGSGLAVAGGLFFLNHSLNRARQLFRVSVLYLPLLLIALVLDRRG